MKKFLSLLLCGLFLNLNVVLPVLAIEETQTTNIEHVKLPKKLAKKAVKIIGKKRPSQVYNINRNFLLLFLKQIQHH